MIGQPVKKFISNTESLIGKDLGYSANEIEQWVELALDRLLGKEVNNLKTIETVNYKSETIFHKKKVNCKPPIFIGRRPKFFEKINLDRLSAELIRYELDNVSFSYLEYIGPVFFDKDFNVIVSFSSPLSQLLPFIDFGFCLKDFLNENIIEKKSGICLFDRFWEANYAHWLLDGMIRTKSQPPSVDLIVSKIRYEWQREMLEVFKHESSEVVDFDLLEVYRYEKIFLFNDTLSTVAHPILKGSPEAVAYIRSFNKNILSVSGRKNALIVIRKNNRRISNLDVIIRKISLKGYIVTIIDSENLNLAEQWEFFSEFSLIISAHGAGLANSIFIPDKCQFVEIMPESYGNPAFWIVNSSRDIDYYIFTGVIYENASSSVRPRNRDFLVDQASVDKLIEILN